MPLWGKEVIEVFGGPIGPDPVLILMYGPPGSGKSTLALKIAHSIAMIEHPVVYLSAEEPPGSTTLRNRLERLELFSDQLFFTDEHNISRLLNICHQVGSEWLIIDSLSVMSFLNEDIEALKSMGLNTLLICHATKDGQYYIGSSLWGHLVDAIITTKDLHYQLTKNRFGPVCQKKPILG